MTAILCIAGPTASGKSARAIEEARARGGEIISVDSRQVYRGLDIGTEKISHEEMRGVPHYLIDIRDVRDSYSAHDFVTDTKRLIEEISSRGKLPILVGGTHFYFDALLNGLPTGSDTDPRLRKELEKLSTEELYARVSSADPRRAHDLDSKNRRRLIRALEIIATLGHVPPRGSTTPPHNPRSNLEKYDVAWIIIDPSREELRERLANRLTQALERGLVEEVRRVSKQVSTTRLHELGLEYRIIGDYLLTNPDLGVSLPSDVIETLSAKLWQYARRQKAWLRKLGHSNP